MSKLTRDSLKSIIKECIVEILTDGLGNNIQESVRKIPAAKRIVEDKSDLERFRESKRRTKDSISFATSDTVLKNILQHTAETTLLEQNANEIPTMRNQRVSSADDPAMGPGLNIDGIFNNNWSTMAFPNEKIR